MSFSDLDGCTFLCFEKKGDLQKEWKKINPDSKQKAVIEAEYFFKKIRKSRSPQNQNYLNKCETVVEVIFV